MASQEIETLAAALARLPGLGPRSARRAVLWLVKRRESALPALLEALATVGEALVECDTCGNVDTTNPCAICADPRRDVKSLCVVEDVADLWAMERSGVFRGRYHVLGGAISPIDGIGPDQLRIRELMTRLADGVVTEVILATDPNLEGEATATYLTRMLKVMDLRVTRLASGLPVGGDLEYADEVTLGRAFEGRRSV